MLDDFVVVVVVVRLAALPSAAAACDLVVTMAACNEINDAGDQINCGGRKSC